MAVGFSNTNKPLNPRGQDASPKGYNRASLFSGKALDFDGVNDEVLSTITISGAKTYCAWINADTTANERIISIAGGGYSNITFSNNKFGMYDGTNIPETTTTFETGEWYFVVSVQEANNAKIYVNGISQPLNTTNWIERTHTGATLAIGRDGGGATAWYDGEISGVRVFNTALTAAQVADLYNNPEKVVPTGLESNLKLWLPMMEGAGTTAYDGSGNGNHGTISGATYVNGIGAPVAQSAVMDWNKGVNIFEHSEEFNDSYWTKARLSITANDIVAPDGQTTADKALETSSTGYRDFGYKSILVTSGQPYTLSAYVKNGLGRDNAYLYTADGSRMAKFNIATGTYIGQASGNGYNAFNSYGIADAGNGWYRIHATLNLSYGGSKTYHLGFSDNTNDVVAPYTGNTSKGLYAWGMQLEQASSVGPYVPTIATAQTSEVLLPQGLTTGRDITGVNLFENVRKQGALNLDGNSWAEVHDNASLDIGEITLECWINSTDKDQYHHILSKNKSGNTSYAILTEITTGYLGFEAVSGEFKKTDYNVMDGNWNHIVVTYDETNLKFYINGALDETIAYTSTIPTNDVDFHIGARPDGVQLFESNIAQPRIYNRALTAEEVQRSYDSGKNIYTNS